MAIYGIGHALELYMVIAYMEESLMSWEVARSYNICKFLAFVR